ncbi:MAG: universal stress protein [Bacteroidota bacterium]|jgi:nucleotide-binding universal stress UspA family protein
MSKIVVAIDFSDCSINAFLHSLSIAQTVKSDLILVWVQKEAAHADKFNDIGKDPTKDVKKAFQELIDKYQPELPSNTITCKIRTGKVYHEIPAEAKESKAYMVVCGTHGASGFEKFWIGSNANRIVSASACPVITIRGGINIKRPLKKIVLSIDSTQETRQKCSFTAMMAKPHDAEVFILKLYSTKAKAIRQNVDLFASQVERFFLKEGVRFNTVAEETENVPETIINYGKKIDANLLSIMTEQESSASTLWLGPYAQQIVNQSPIPVLSVHSKDVYTGLGF